MPFLKFLVLNSDSDDSDAFSEFLVLNSDSDAFSEFLVLNSDSDAFSEIPCAEQ